MKKILSSLGMIVFVGAVVVGGTGAFFSDTETSTTNVFTAGAIDLKVDSVGHVNGLVCFEKAWTPETIVKWVPENGDVEGFLELDPADASDADVIAENDAYNTANPANVPKAGDDCASTWALTDLEDGVHTFFNFDDIKPGDEGENTISLHVDDNDSWMCVDVDITKNDDMSSTEPELESGDDQDTASLFDGELADHMNFFAWADDGDNIWEVGEPELFSNTSGPASDVLGGRTYTLADSITGTPFPGATTQYIGLAWCAGTIDASVEGTIDCDGSTMGNEAQTDSMTADIAFRVEQARNNEHFVCNERDGGGLACNEENDVVFVLDSSGSIDAGELGVMSTAAKAFAAALAPASPGNHIGVVDFDGGATLNSELTDVLAEIDTAIDALVSGGSTNLAAGISLASTELAGPRDRDDVTVAPDFMLIMTDGEPNDEADAVIAADAAKAAGTTVYVVGIGNGVNDAFLEGIATSAAHYFTAAEFADLETLLSGLADCPINNITN